MVCHSLNTNDHNILSFCPWLLHGDDDYYYYNTAVLKYLLLTGALGILFSRRFESKPL